MSFIKIDNVNILGIACAVPKNISNISNSKFSSITGVFERRITTDNICTSDLCLASANQLIKDMNVDKNEIEILVFISQTPDYKLPVTSTILQHKLDLPQSCICFDIPLGCSGYVYGLSIISSLINSGKIKKGLLLVGDTISKEVDQNDQGTEPLFGDAGSATLLEYNENSNPILFGLGSDGSGFESIIIRGGNNREKLSSDRLILNGMDVFNFGINKIPKIFNEFLVNFKLNKDNIDLFVFHQANKFMNDKIYKKLNIPESKTISSLYNFGNTSSATIPLTIITQNSYPKKDTKLVMCGFGVGLSWGTVFIHLNKDLYCSKLIEL
jgi:3-oxoacyl-[acyl-carrier-protein] synthase-3